MSVDLVLVHSGNRFPSYINDTIALTLKYNFKIHLILEQKFHNLIYHKNIKLIDVDSVIDKRYQQYTLKNYDSQFRNGFFPRTSSRFILIDNYAKQSNLKYFFHIENDIAIFSNLINIQHYLSISQFDTALIMDHPLRCVPSIIWYRDSIASNRMANHIYHNNNIDDMKNLAIYFHKNRKNVTNLPIVPFNLINYSFNINFGNLYNEFHSIFDGAAIGQYLYGIDTTDDSNINTKGFINETSVFNVSTANIIMNNKPELILDSNIIPINNLHMHCKNLKQLL